VLESGFVEKRFFFKGGGGDFFTYCVQNSLYGGLISLRSWRDCLRETLPSQTTPPAMQAMD